MLVLTRKCDESIRIGSEIVVRVVRLSRGKVRIGIEALLLLILMVMYGLPITALLMIISTCGAIVQETGKKSRLLQMILL